MYNYKNIQPSPRKFLIRHCLVTPLHFSIIEYWKNSPKIVQRNTQVLTILQTYSLDVDLSLICFLEYYILTMAQLFLRDKNKNKNKTYLSSSISENVFDFLRVLSCSSISNFFTSTTLSIMCSTRFRLHDFQLSKF